MLLKNR